MLSFKNLSDLFFQNIMLLKADLVEVMEVVQIDSYKGLFSRPVLRDTKNVVDWRCGGLGIEVSVTEIGSNGFGVVKG